MKLRWFVLVTAAWACTAPVQSAVGPADAAADTGFGGQIDVAADGAKAADSVVDAPADVAPIPDVPAATAPDGGPDAATEVGADLPVDDAGQPTATSCTAAEKLCLQPFSYTAAGDEAAVEVRGSWNGWQPGATLGLNAGVWSATVKLPQGTDIQYKFRITLQNGKEAWKTDPGNPLTADDTFGGKNSLLAALSCPTDGVCPQAETVCGAAQKPGDFDWRDGVMYFVFVDRFANGNPGNDAKASDPKLPEIANWHGGDWAGVTQKINAGYFAALGVNVLWLTVPMDPTDAIEVGDDGKPYSGYHGYWPRDVGKANAHFGTLAELQALVQAAHGQGIRIVLDYAMNHVHKSAPVFAQHADWFHPLQVNGQDCVCGASVCPWDGPSGVFCWFRDYLPDFDFNNAAARKASIDNVLWWMDQSGADGLRLDAIKHVEGAWLTELRQRLTAEFEAKTGHHPWLVGETYTGDQAFIKTFVQPCAKLDGQFDFPLRAVLDQVVLLRQGKMADLENFFKTNDKFYGDGAVMSTFAGNHDLPRIIHYAQDVPLYADVWNPGRDKAFANQPQLVAEKSAYERVFVAMAVLFGSPGVPLVYYGDEIGLPGAGDPDNRRPLPWEGFSANQTWLLGRHQALGQARKNHPALRRGVRQPLWATPDALLWAMTGAGETVYVAVNRGDSAQTLQGLPDGVALQDALGGAAVTGPSVTLPARSAQILFKQ